MMYDPKYFEEQVRLTALQAHWSSGFWWGCALGIVATGAGVLFVRWMGWAT